MKIQVLVTTMHADDFTKISEMNLRNVDVIIANQTNHCGFEEQFFLDRNVHAILVSTNTRGVSLNRNIAIAYSTEDILVFADDDMVFQNSFSEDVRMAFEEAPDADAVKFYCESSNPKRPLSYKGPSSFSKIHKRDLMPAGVPAFAVKRDFLLDSGVLFRLNMGPGALWPFGEDGVFYNDLFKHNPKVYGSPVLVAYVKQENSSWFRGYDEDYFRTIGHSYSILYGCLAPLAAVRRAWNMRHRDTGMSFKKILTLMLMGARRDQ